MVRGLSVIVDGRWSLEWLPSRAMVINHTVARGVLGRVGRGARLLPLSSRATLTAGGRGTAARLHGIPLRLPQRAVHVLPRSCIVVRACTALALLYGSSAFAVSSLVLCLVALPRGAPVRLSLVSHVCLSSRRRA